MIRLLLAVSLLGALVCFAALYLISVLAIFVLGLVLRFIAFVLSTAALDRAVKVATLAVFLVGFHFDLLAS